MNVRKKLICNCSVGTDLVGWTIHPQPNERSFLKRNMYGFAMLGAYGCTQRSARVTGGLACVQVV